MNIRFPSDDSMEIAQMVLKEREHALSDREWLHRIKLYGVTVKETETGPKIARLSDGKEICALPPL